MQDVMSLDGKTIVVTGAAQGIGRAIANLAIALRARVAGVDLNGEKLDAFAATTNGRLLPYVGNVADPEFTDATVRDIMARIGAIDGLVNNAGITRPAMIEKMTLQQWSEVISVHLTGAFLWTQAVGLHHGCSGKDRSRKSGIHREYFVGRWEGRLDRPDQLCRRKERTVGHDDVGREGMVKIRCSNQLRLLRRG